MTDPSSQYDPSCMDDFDPNSMNADAAQRHILESMAAIQESEMVPIRQALGRVVASEIYSAIDVPSHTNSAMDGYAIRSEDIPKDQPEHFTLIGTAWAGRPYQGNVSSKQCVRIMTGAAMPEGTDTVVMQEHVQVEDKQIQIDQNQSPKQNVRLAGEDIPSGALVFAAGKLLQAADIGLLASLGITEVSVYRKLRVAFFSTGDELVGIGTPLQTGQIYDSNRYTLWSMLTRLGVEINDLGVIRDTREEVEQAFLTAAKNADIVITSGGVSVGDADFVKATLAKLGQVNFWKVAMKPGRPLAFGKINDAYFFGLPGNPVSVMVTFYVFVQAAIHKLMGAEAKQRIRIMARSDTELRKRPGRVEYQRGIYRINAQGEYVVEKTGEQGSGILRSMSDANCFMYLPMESTGIKKGELIEIWPFDSII